MFTELSKYLQTNAEEIITRISKTSQQSLDANWLSWSKLKMSRQWYKCEKNGRKELVVVKEEEVEEPSGKRKKVVHSLLTCVFSRNDIYCLTAEK